MEGPPLVTGLVEGRRLELEGLPLKPRPAETRPVWGGIRFDSGRGLRAPPRARCSRLLAVRISGFQGAGFLNRRMQVGFAALRDDSCRGREERMPRDATGVAAPLSTE